MLNRNRNINRFLHSIKHCATSSTTHQTDTKSTLPYPRASTEAAAVQINFIILITSSNFNSLY
ncbi:hypothetical protein BGI08_02050 [Snodgrassella alvi]|nr:hypothetical protein BGI08_02050 [Snodgrassella alvi]